MADFIGTTVLVVLKDPSRSQLQGRITNVVAGQGDSELILEDVYFLSTNQYLPHFRVGGSNVADISIVSPRTAQRQQAQRASIHQAQFQQPQLGTPFQDPAIVNAPTSFHSPAGPPPPYGYQQQFGQPSTSQHHHQHPQQHQPQSQQQQQQLQSRAPPPPPIVPVFDDPAIVSMSKPAAKPSAGPSQNVPPPQPSQNPFVTTPTRSPASLSMPPPKMGMMGPPTSRPTRPSVDSNKTRKSNIRAEQTMKAFSNLNLENDGGIESSAVEETDNDFSFSPMPPPPRNENRKFLQQKRLQRGKSIQGVRSRVHHDAEMGGSTVIRPGMFGGSIAQAAFAGTHTPPRRNIRRRQQRHQRGSRYDNGTADEEGWATEDVNEYNQTEFDFQGNLDRFDKKTVFNQIRAEDTVAESDRLVSHNRLPRKSSTQPAPQKNFLHSENVLGQYANGKVSLAERAGWDTPDQMLDETDETDTDSDIEAPVGSGNAADSGRSSRRTLSRQSLTRMGRTQSNNILGRGGSSENLPALAKPSKASLRLGPTNRACPIVTPLQMLDVERIAEVELGLTDDMMTENAARAIAQVAIQAFGKRISASNFNALPVVLAMVGNTKSGARVIAAARHLKNHSVRVMIIGVGLEREDELLVSVKKQLAIFRNSGGTFGRWEEMQPKIAGLDSPAELIIDGLLGIHKDFDDLRTEDQASTYELVQFANKSKAAVLSVDVPSGVDGNTGEVADIQDTGPFHVRSTIVVALGAPKMGLLNACKSGIGHNWKLYVADIGISNTAWRKYGTRRRHGVEFAADWVVPLHFSLGRSE